MQLLNTSQHSVRWPTLARVSLFLCLLLVLVHGPVFACAATSVGRAVRPLHGPGYEHLDCSACLTVSRALYDRLNGTLSENPSTYLASHRLNRANKLRRLPYRNSELLVTEVMDNFCRSYENDERVLRLHPKSKVRAYHMQIWKDTALNVRRSLREDEVYPDGANELWWGDAVELRRYSVATVYSLKDQEALHGMELLAATPTMCAALIEHFEEEMEELVKVAHALTDVEYGLCGLPLADASDDAEEVRATIRPITNVCAQTEVLRAAAQQDQLRWSQYMRREERRKAKAAAKLAAQQKNSAEPEATEETANASAAEEVSVVPENANTETPAKDDGSTTSEEAPTLEESNGLPPDSDNGDL